ncbi:MAG: hypothetical protein B7733_01210 [Myxococcales bacterium FL481]|nr:MAG: hypothetical protein B7733_01210 [Myxococcales bacterium FL481]
MRCSANLCATALVAMLACDRGEPERADDSVVVATSSNDAAFQTADTSGHDESPSLPADVTLTWENFGDGYVRDWCRGCHSMYLEGAARYGAPPGVDFNTHEGVQERLERVIARATGDQPTMPPAGGPTADERELLLQWLDAGAP